MSILAINWALKQPVPSSTAKFVLAILANCSDAQGCCYPSTQHLVDATAQDRKTVLNGLSKLESLGFIKDTGQRCGRTAQVKVWQLVGFLGSETNPKTASLNDPKIGTVSDADSVQLNALTVPNKAPLNNTEIGTLYDITVPNMELLNSTENGTVPKTEQYQFSAETVPFFPANSTVFPPKESQKRDTDKSGTIMEPKEREERASARGSRLPPDWNPSIKQIQWAKTKRPDLLIEDEIENFRDHWTAKPGKEGLKLSWDGAWRTWIRKAFRKSNSTKSKSDLSPKERFKHLTAGAL